MLLCFDDTDSREGGCTTHLALSVLLAIPEVALRGMPRLVRLNPNVPHKTRGNAAVALPLCRPSGPQVQVGELRGRDILAFPEGGPVDAATASTVLEQAWRAVDGAAQPSAAPCVVAALSPPAPWIYADAVRTAVDLEPVAQAAKDEGIPWRARSDAPPQGLVGALAAASWPGPPTSFELIAYRQPARWGTPRAIHRPALEPLDRSGASFHSWDLEADRCACVPATPCPVLCGIRGRDPERLVAEATRVMGGAASEPVDAWLLWATNQASGEHVTPVTAVADAPPWATIEVKATVRDRPTALRGGHVTVHLADADGAPCAAIAFEPTGRFRTAVLALRKGDQVTATGAWKNGAIHLEKLQVRALAPGPGRPPRCDCGTRMKSAGRGAGYRCPSCSARAKDAEPTTRPRSLRTGWHEVPVRARRHLHRPIAWDAP